MKRLLILIVAIIVIVTAAVLFTLWPGPPLNVVIVSIDTLRPDHLGCHGYHRDTSPAMDRLAREGTRFENAVSTTSWTLPAHIALLTSLPDLVHGVLWDNYHLNGSRITLAEIMKEQGYRTAGIFTGPYLLPRFGFDQGFDYYIDCTLYDKKLKGMDVLVASERGRTTPGAMEKVEIWLNDNQNHPFFLFLHLFDVHPDFDPPPPFDTIFDPDYSGGVDGKDVFHNPAIHAGMERGDLEHLRALYDGEIRFVDDAGIARLMEMLEERNLAEKTLVVITSDHGEEFFEHGEFGHRKNLYDTTLRIPLIFWRPGLVPQGKVIERQVRITDVMPTILELLDLPQSPETLGQSLVPLLKGEDIAGGDALRGFAEITSDSIHMEALRTEEFKFVRDYRKNEDLYFIYREDPDEMHALTDTNGSGFIKAQNLFDAERNALIMCGKAIPRTEADIPPMDSQTRERLESLGYME